MQISSPSIKVIVHELLLVAGLTAAQVVVAGYGVFLSHLLSLGLTYLFFVIYGSLATAIILSPFAIYFERSKWPKEFRPVLLLQLVLIALGGITLYQVLVLVGMKNTSPAIASAMSNLAPGIIFIIAWCLRLERVDLSCKYTKVKIAGTLMCLIGALAISFLQGSPTSKSVNNSPQDTFQKHRLMGCMYLIAAVVIGSFTIVLQAATMKKFPAPLTLCAVTSYIGSLLSVVVQFINKGTLETGSKVVSLETLVLFALVGGSVTGSCVGFQAWAMKKRGPVLVSMFSPIGTVCSAIITKVTLGESLTIGSMVGMLLMFSGLYLVLWAKKNEDYPLPQDSETLEENQNGRKPLLS